jgi:hypothetical protein
MHRFLLWVGIDDDIQVIHYLVHFPIKLATSIGLGI